MPNHSKQEVRHFFIANTSIFSDKQAGNRIKEPQMRHIKTLQVQKAYKKYKHRKSYRHPSYHKYNYKNSPPTLLLIKTSLFYEKRQHLHIFNNICTTWEQLSTNLDNLSNNFYQFERYRDGCVRFFCFFGKISTN